jgi:polyhydroxyalkanoate synthase subunit PhaC
MNWNTTGMMEEMSNNLQKLAKGYETLQSIEEVDIATTPKKLVWQRDKVKMYHYIRETPATCKIPVMVSFAMLKTAAL